MKAAEDGLRLAHDEASSKGQEQASGIPLGAPTPKETMTESRP